MESTQRPTPETNAAWATWPYAGPGVHANFARKLERERDEARAELDAMREAIMEAHDLIKDCSARASDTTITMHPDDHAKGCIDDIWEWSDAALAKLQPFIKP